MIYPAKYAKTISVTTSRARIHPLWPQGPSFLRKQEAQKAQFSKRSRLLSGSENRPLRHTHPSPSPCRAGSRTARATMSFRGPKLSAPTFYSERSAAESKNLVAVAPYPPHPDIHRIPTDTFPLPKIPLPCYHPPMNNPHPLSPFFNPPFVSTTENNESPIPHSFAHLF